MQRARLAAVAAAVLLAVAAGRPGAAAALDDLVPADAAVVVTVRDVAATVDRWTSTPFADLWDDPQIARFFAPLRASLEGERWDEMVDAETGYDVDRLLDLVTGDLVLYMPRRAETATEGVEGLASVVALAEVGEGAAELERRILARQEARSGQDKGEGGIVWVTRSFSGVDMRVDRQQNAGGFDEQLSWAVFDGLVALASSPALLEQVISDRQRGSAAQPLGSSTAYASVSRFLRGRDATVFIDLERVLPPLRAALRDALGDDSSSPIPVDPDALYNALGLDGLRAAFATLTMSDSGLDLDMGLTYGSDQGLVKLLAYGPGEAPRTRLIPSDAVNFGTARFDFATAWQALEDIVNRVNPSLLAMAGAQVSAMIQNAGVELDLRRDLLDNLDGEVFVVQRPPVATTSSRDEPPSVTQSQVVGLRVRQRQGFELALETLKTMAGRGSQLFESRDYLDTTIYSLALAPAGGQTTVAYAFSGDYFLLSLGTTSVLESVLMAARDRGSSVWRTPRVQRAVDMLPAGASAINYQDLATSGQAAFQGLAMLASVDPTGELAICDPSAVPDSEVLGSYLGPAVGGVYKDGTALIARVKVLPPDTRRP